MLIDTHAHVNFNAYKNDANDVIRRSLDNNVWMINVGSQYDTSKRAVEMAEKYPEGVYAAVGLHPIHLETGLVKIRTIPRFARQNLDSSFRSELKADPEEIQFQTTEESFDYEKYKDLALRSFSEGGKVVAIGETGFDYYWKPKTKIKIEQFKQKQKEVFLKQLDLAKELNLPVIFHCRMAHDDLIQTIQQSNNPTIKGVIHCFTGNWEQAEKYLEMGLYLGFNGIIFKLDLDEIINKTPLEKILIETDCPYLTPPLPAVALAKAGPQLIRNEHLYVKYVAEKIAKIKNINYEEVTKITAENAKKLFRI